MSRFSKKGHRWRTARALVLAASDTCHICGHGGSTDADHVLPLSRFPDQPLDVALLRPAHGATPCPVCGQRCNASRGNRMTWKTPVRSRIW